MDIFLGVDGGQSSTTALIGDINGRVIGSGRGGPCNHVGAAEGHAKFTSAINGCLGQACAAAGLDPKSVRFRSACLGFSGGPEDKQALLAQMIRTEQLMVTHDALVGLVGATAGAPGIVTIGGTGSIAFGRNGAGRTARAGGWGYIFGDEGGAFDVTRQALRAALRYEEGWGPKTALTQLFQKAIGERSINEVMHRMYTTEFTRERIASFSRLVDAAADQGDHLARDILQNAAHHLARYAGAVRQQLFSQHEPARIAYLGGVFKSEILLHRFKTLLEMEHGNTVGPPKYGPATGALIEAYRMAGVQVQLDNVPAFEK